MCNGPMNNLIDSFSTFQFLRTYHRLMAPTENKLRVPYGLIVGDVDGFENVQNASIPSEPSYISATDFSSVVHSSPIPASVLHRTPSLDSLPSAFKRHRGEKRSIPEEQKDAKYFERRKRNNEAAKKSRDARKLREDRIAFRAAILEQENAILRSQAIALREEVTTLRQMLCNRENN